MCKDGAFKSCPAQIAHNSGAIAKPSVRATGVKLESFPFSRFVCNVSHLLAVKVELGTSQVVTIGAQKGYGRLTFKSCPAQIAHNSGAIPNPERG